MKEEPEGIQNIQERIDRKNQKKRKE